MIYSYHYSLTNRDKTIDISGIYSRNFKILTGKDYEKFSNDIFESSKHVIGSRDDIAIISLSFLGERVE